MKHNKFIWYTELNRGTGELILFTSLTTHCAALLLSQALFTQFFSLVTVVYTSRY